MVCDLTGVYTVVPVYSSTYYLDFLSSALVDSCIYSVDGVACSVSHLCSTYFFPLQYKTNASLLSLQDIGDKPDLDSDANTVSSFLNHLTCRPIAVLLSGGFSKYTGCYINSWVQQHFLECGPVFLLQC